MRKLVLLSAASFLLVFVAAPSSTRSRTSEDKVYGYFSLAGTVPAAFKNIDHINLSIPAYEEPGKPPDYGRIRLKGNKPDYVLVKPTLEGKNLTFKTKAVGGVSYEFSGTLTRTDFDEPRPADGEIVLRGTLKKIQAGKTIAESKVSFTWELGD
jgi:hypothetical protein